MKFLNISVVSVAAFASSILGAPLTSRDIQGEIQVHYQDGSEELGVKLNIRPGFHTENIDRFNASK
jgi:hypothetical protein